MSIEFHDNERSKFEESSTAIADSREDRVNESIEFLRENFLQSVVQSCDLLDSEDYVR